MSRNLFTNVSIALLCGALALTGCSSDDETADPGPVSGGAGESDPAPEGDSDPGESTGSSYTAEDSGNGNVTVDGELIDGFTGDCEVTRGNGAEDVGDLSVEGIELLLVVDTIDEENPPADPNAGFNYTVTGTPNRFRAANIGDGIISNIEYVDGPSPLGDTTEIGVVGVYGTTDEGADVAAEFVCIVQNSFS